MAKRVFLHIGTMKSATTYIQDLCDLNTKALAEQGLFWSWSTRSFAAMDDLLGTGNERPGVTGTWKPLRAEIEAHDGDVLISNELLAAAPKKRIAALIEAFGDAELHVIITTRDLARVIPSQWQTMTRNRHTVRWKDFVSATKSRVTVRGTPGGQFWAKQDLAAIVRRWSEQIPVGQITVVTVPPKGSPHDLLSKRFGSVIGVDLASLPQPGRSNPALGGHSAELMRRMNRRTKDWDWHHYQLAFKNATARHVLEARAAQEPTVSLGQKDLKWVRRRSERMIEETRATGVRVVGDLDDLLPSADLPRTPADPDAISDAELLEVAEIAAVGLAKLLADLRIEYRNLAESFSRVDPVDTESAEWKEFSALDAAEDEPHLASRRGRFLVWRERKRRRAGRRGGEPEPTPADDSDDDDGRQEIEAPD